MTYCKKLIEVAPLLLDDIKAESAREKSIRHGHPSTLHLWWARRPLAACRAVIFASLIDDPSEPYAPPELLQRMDELPAPDPLPVGWDEMVGLEAHGSDLNPVAVMITKALIELPPKFAGEPPVNPESRKTADLFTSRQLVALGTFSELVREAREKVYEDVMFAGRMCLRPSGEDVMGAGRASALSVEEAREALGARASSLHKDPRGWHSRGYLPHFDGGTVTQAITFRLAGSLPKARITELEGLPGSKVRERIEDHLDRGHGEAWLSNPKVAEVVQNALLHFDGERYDLHAWVIMPNHVHALVTPREGVRLSDILHSWKSYSAREANRILGRTGTFWQDEYFDRYIRDERHFAAAMEYIENNPVKAGLCGKPEEWRFSSASRRQTLSCGQDGRAPR